MCLPLCLDCFCLLQMLFFLLWSSPGKSSLALGTLTHNFSVPFLVQLLVVKLLIIHADPLRQVSLAMDEKDFEFYHIVQNAFLSFRLTICLPGSPPLRCIFSLHLTHFFLDWERASLPTSWEERPCFWTLVTSLDVTGSCPSYTSSQSCCTFMWWGAIFNSK